MQEQVTDQLLRVAQDCDDITQAVKEVLIADENTDITLTDGTTTPSLSKRVKQWGGQVTKVVDKVGDVTAEDIANALELGTAAKQDATDLMRAINLSDESGLTQQKINKARKYVNTVSDLKKVKALNGDIVGANGHTVVGLGGGVFAFEQLSSKSDNNGAWIASTVSPGVWVLTSDLHFENFGVVTDTTISQSSKIQACLDFAWENKIFAIAFEKPNTYVIGETVVFKASKTSEITTYYDTSTKT